MRPALLLSLAAVLSAAEDPREIIRRTVALEERNFQAARNYTFLERNELWELDDAKVRNRRVRTYDVTLLEGSPYRRLIQRDDHALPSEEEAREAEKLRASIAERRRETPEQRKRRLEEWEKKRRKQREFLAEIPEAFRFRLVGEEQIAQRPTWVIAADPQPGYHGKTSIGRFFPHIQGKLWIDKQSCQWVRADLEVVETISWGLFLARIAKGTRASAQQALVNGEVWMPQHVNFEANARIALIKKIRLAGDITYRNYRKFQVESRVITEPSQ